MSWDIPPVTESTYCFDRDVIDGGEPARARVRLVMLWGRQVAVTVDGAQVVCPACDELLPVAVVGDRESPHAVSWPPQVPRPLPRDGETCDEERWASHGRRRWASELPW